MTSICKSKTGTKKGFSMLEIVLAVALISIFSTSAILFSLHSLSTIGQSSMHESALSYASECLEVVRTIRNNSFEELGEFQSKGLIFENDKWRFQDENDSFGKYSRSVKIENAKRDGDRNIADEGGEDAGMKHVECTISWLSIQGENLSVEVETYLSNWKSL